VWRFGSDSCGLEEGRVASSCDHGNERPCFINEGEFLDQLRNHSLIKKDSDQ
jgi:hypothetical protein